MIHKENRTLFYIYFAIFLLIAYIGRNILSPHENGFKIHFQILALCILPISYRYFITTSKTVAATLFFLYFVFLWEVVNFVPVLGVALSIYFYSLTNINLGLGWSFVVLKPLAMILFIWLNRTSIFSFFNALVAEKNYCVDNLDTKTLFERFNENIPGQEYTNNLVDAQLHNMKYYAPQNSYFYLNQNTQLITLFFNKTNQAKKKSYLSLAHEEHNYFFLNKRNVIVGSKIKLRNNVLLIIHKEQNVFLVYDINKFTPSLKEAIHSIVNVA